jgi:hypothetical protein
MVCNSADYLQFGFDGPLSRFAGNSLFGGLLRVFFLHFSSYLGRCVGDSLFGDFLSEVFHDLPFGAFLSTFVNGPRFGGIVNGSVPGILCRAMAEMGAIRLDKDGNFVSADSDLAVKEVGSPSSKFTRGSKLQGGDS